MNEILNILSSLHPEITFDSKTELIDSGILDSFDVVTLIGDLYHTFKIEIGVENIEPENFATPETIFELLKALGAKL